MFPYVKTQRIIREGFIDDFISYNFLQTFILGIFISYLIELIDSTSGISRLQLITDWSIWLQVFLFIITHDFYIYVFHKWQHKNKYLWRLHEAHHSPKEVDWLSGVRSHALEILINQTVEFLPIVLLGSPPEVAVYQATISAVWGMYIHSNIDVHTGKLQYVINGPEMHRWHHSTGKGRNRNFSTKLAIWDWIFGTAYLPEEKAAEYGLKTYFPGNYFKQLAFAFRSFKKRERV
jgi:sterol desaturase/sphingolipid hydroxylase (fatty acid hydroxylase superfamily)